MVLPEKPPGKMESDWGAGGDWETETVTAYGPDSAGKEQYGGVGE